MKKRRLGWSVGVVALSLLVAGVVAFAGNGFGRGAGAGTQAACASNLDADGDGIPNGQDPDWVAPCDGTGYGAGQRSAGDCSGSCAGGESCSGMCRGAQGGQGYGRMSSRAGGPGCGGGS